MSRLPIALALILLTACAGEAPPSSEPELAGSWRAVLQSPGGELPFELEIRSQGAEPAAVVINGEEEAPVSSVEREGKNVILEFDGYDSKIVATLSEDGRRLDGRWVKTVPDGTSELPFTASRGQGDRFQTPASDVRTPASAAVPTVGGSWQVLFTDEDGSEEAVGEFRQEGEEVTGTFLTPTGDYRFLEGAYRNGFLQLSTFDGAHAFLFHARAEEDGTLAGDFWSRDSYHATWTARRLDSGDAEEVLPDPFGLVQLTNDEQRFGFELPALDGEILSSEDPRFDGKVVLVNLFGSWCPNCNDEAPVLARWHREYRDQGLEIVGLAFEFTGDPERDRRFVEKYAERHGLEYPMALAGISDKEEAAKALPDIDRVVAYPTTIFLGRNGKVRYIHSGFAGPGTGEHHRKMVAELEGKIEELLAEPAGA